MPGIYPFTFLKSAGSRLLNDFVKILQLIIVREFENTLNSFFVMAVKITRRRYASECGKLLYKTSAEANIGPPVGVPVIPG
jgi:hypothetical protein